MASAIAAMGQARRGIIRRQKKANVAKGILDTTAVVASFVGGQAKKADTAWGEYEAGYKAIDDTAKIPERPKIGRGYFKGPQDDVQIGGSLYDRSKIQKAGAFLGSDASAMLEQKTRDEYLQRTAPGRKLPTMQIPTQPGATTQASGVLPDTPQFPTQEPEQKRSGGIGWGKFTGDLVKTVGSNDFYSEQLPLTPSYAHGGDFITNGPQEILVGDNPGGRERVTIKPLPSKNDEDIKGHYGKAYSWLEALYANNEKRKKY